MKIFDKPLSFEQEKEYLLRLSMKDKEAYEILIMKNMRLVAHIVKKYSTTDIEMDDLLSIGTIGLIKAIKSYKPDKGIRLATYAAKCIDNEILMSIRSNKKRAKDISLNDTIGTDKEGNDISLMDFIEGETGDIIDTIEKKDDIIWLNGAIKTMLTPRERLIIGLRYGLFGNEENTQQEIAKKLGISRSYYAVTIGG